MNGASYRTAGRFLSACLLLVALTGQAKIGVVYQMQLGDPTDAKPDRSNHEHYLIQRSVLAEDYDDERGDRSFLEVDGRSVTPSIAADHRCRRRGGI